VRGFLLLVAVLCAACVKSDPAESLVVTPDGLARILVTIHFDLSSGSSIEFKCLERCPKPIAYREDIGDDPMGLFSMDDGFVYSLWSGGVAYRVRVWQISGGTIRKVGELNTRGRPDFLHDADGRPIIRTYESEGGTTPVTQVTWTIADGRFARSDNSTEVATLKR
jgi:hypothetical protein